MRLLRLFETITSSCPMLGFVLVNAHKPVEQTVTGTQIGEIGATGRSGPSDAVWTFAELLFNSAASVVDSRYAAVSAREAAARTDQPRAKLTRSFLMDNVLLIKINSKWTIAVSRAKPNRAPIDFSRCDRGSVQKISPNHFDDADNVQGAGCWLISPPSYN
ncbi:uncharacterized protein BO96DRAFT_432984 [Aspergillus niger CBS 101883]|uniref:Contig An07c0130, genomic contig n=2 Tax=Aspergillus niger TaxID=5061 RepID=A2QNE6_ASPNC|nr:uncharacterized protein BO96DRAFT_432984 [Aspergillus niger CBS 101883]XP_059600949.1 uncharacterized protein An07g05390 [Aspergillus niger]PYH57515.1 hypothetical protein BO96DRAFT_432984 [Aspergillus niger CBS 101883]CAK39455.1 unnamed protein product [Aspergillus niger]